MKFRWSLAPAHPLLADSLARELRLSPLLAQCLINRHLDRPAIIQAFLQPRLRHLSDPFLLPNMAAAVERLFLARSRGESIVIFGDYDVDGVTSTALLLETLRDLGWNVGYYLPHRRDDGYGLSEDGLEHCFEKHSPTLLLAVDCGSTSCASIKALKSRSVDVIVLDHHQISEPPPDCAALVNPQLPDHAASDAANGNEHAPCGFRELCSAGLAFKLAHALVKRGREIGLAAAASYDIRPLLELVALGTIADLVPLTGENRILVSAGLDRLNHTTRPGLVALKRGAQCAAELGTFEVGFQLAPRLNAAGRLETAEEALLLLLTRDAAEADKLAASLCARNRERQEIERSIAEQAIECVRAKFKPDQDFVIVEGQSPWHIGVVGIVASRVLQQFNRPTIILGGDGPQLRGSGRSIDGFDLAVALRECGDLLLRHGGHAMAAGVSMVPENLEAFRQRLNSIARQSLTAERLQRPLHLDAKVTLDQIHVPTLLELAQLKPTGQGNPPLQFEACGLTHSRAPQRIGPEKQHAKMWVTDGSATLEALWWKAGDEALPEGKFDLAFSPSINEYNGTRRVQLKLLDWRPTAGVGGPLRP